MIEIWCYSHSTILHLLSKRLKVIILDVLNGFCRIDFGANSRIHIFVIFIYYIHNIIIRVLWFKALIINSLRFFFLLSGSIRCVDWQLLFNNNNEWNANWVPAVIECRMALLCGFFFHQLNYEVSTNIVKFFPLKLLNHWNCFTFLSYLYNAFVLYYYDYHLPDLHLPVIMTHASYHIRYIKWLVYLNGYLDWLVVLFSVLLVDFVSSISIRPYKEMSLTK